MPQCVESNGSEGVDVNLKTLGRSTRRRVLAVLAQGNPLDCRVAINIETRR